MTQLSIRAQITDLYEDRHGVAVRFGAVGEDGANDAWTGYAGPESSLRLEMTLSPEAVERAGLTVNQRFTINFELDDRHATAGEANLAPAQPDSGPHLVHDGEGGLTEVSAAEATARGYDVAPDGAAGLAVGPQQHAPVLSLPDEQIDAQTGQDRGQQVERGVEADAYGATPAEPVQADYSGPHGEVHDAEDEADPIATQPTFEPGEPTEVEAPALVTDRHDNDDSKTAE